MIMAPLEVRTIELEHRTIRESTLYECVYCAEIFGSPEEINAHIEDGPKVYFGQTREAFGRVDGKYVPVHIENFIIEIDLGRHKVTYDITHNRGTAFLDQKQLSSVEQLTLQW